MIAGRMEPTTIVAVEPPPPMLNSIVSVPEPAAQSPAVVSLSLLELLSASRSEQTASPATALSSEVFTVIVESARLATTAGPFARGCNRTKSVSESLA